MKLARVSRSVRRYRDWSWLHLLRAKMVSWRNGVVIIRFAEEEWRQLSSEKKRDKLFSGVRRND